MNWKRILIASLCFVVYMALVIWLGFALSFADSQLALFCALLGLLGLAAVLTTLWYLNKLDRSRNELENFSSPDSVNLHALLRDANQRIRSAGRGGIKSISDLPLLYVLGDENSAKTLTVLKSGLNPELLAGAVNQDASVMPTQLVNLWLSGNWVIGEAGGSMLRQPTLFNQFAKSTIPARLGSAFASDSRLPARLALVCVSIERILAPNTAEQIRALAQQLNERLRHLSQTLGVALPVYVLFTKLDTVSPFTDYAVRLTEEEVMQPVGSLLPSSNAHAGYYAEEATAAVSQQFDSMIFALSEYRLEVLSREGQLAELAHAYEFPRDLRKLRKGIVSFLVEVARPSQIGVNPFLRGFFFSGVRPHFVQSILDVGPAMPAQQASMDDPDATRAFTFQSTPHRPAPARAPQGPSSRKEAQWVFLPQLMSRIVLADKLAQEASRSSTRTHMLRRILLGSAIAATTMLLFLATVSYFNNHKLVRRVTETASGPVLTPSGGSLAAQSDLERLETLRQQVELLEKYRTDGPPTLYRMGLYHGNALLPYACQAYADRFRALLLAPTQTGIVNRLSSLPLTPTKDDSYVATYRPLKAYLITATNPNPDTPQDTTEFLPEALLTAWNSNNAADAETSRLAMLQFAFYARHLAAPDSCMATVGGGRNQDVVVHARVYLGGFEGFQHIYQSMIAAANRTSASFTFNQKFPGSAQYITDDYTIQGAFTKDGFTFMQNAILHPDAYFGGERWVLGATSQAPIDRGMLAGQLRSVYSADFLSTWRGYLHKAQFTGYQSLQDAAGKLSVLDGDSSTVLELLSVVAANTRVADAEIAQAFQAPQSLLPQAGLDARLIAAPNQPYIQSLQGIEAAIKGVLANPTSANDPAAYGPIGQAAVNADQAAKATSIGFVPDRQGNVDKVTLAIMEAPIEAAEALAAQAPARAAGGAAKNFCAQIAPTMAKFPFNPQSSQDATPEEVAQIFAPGQGSFAQFANGSLRSMVVQQGGQFVVAPGSTVKINPAFLHFLTSAQKVSSSMFANGGNQPALDFMLVEVRSGSSAEANLTIDGKELKGSGQSGTFHWVAQPGSQITLATPQDMRNFKYSWSLLHFAYAGTQTSANRLKFSFSLNNQAPEVVYFDTSGAGAALLNVDFMRNFHCVSAVGR